MKKILSSFLLIFTVLVSYAVPYITVTEECSHLRFSGSTLQDIAVDKSQLKLQQTSTKVSVVFLSGGAQTLSWDSKQARSYGYSLDSLYDFILEKLKIQCDTSGEGISQSTLDDSLAAIRNYIENNTYIQTDSSTITDYVVLASQNAPPGSPTAGDTYLVGNSPSGAWVGHEKDIAEWNGSSWDFTDGVQGDYLYNTTNALTYIFRAGNWVQTTGIPALNNGNNISNGLKIGTNNNRSLIFETNNVNRGRIDSIGRLHIYNLPTSTDTFVTVSNSLGQFGKIGKSSFLSGISGGVADSSLFPNGLAEVTESRELTSSDIGKLLIIVNDSVVVTPASNMTTTGSLPQTFGIWCLNPTTKTSGFKVNTSSEITYLESFGMYFGGGQIVNFMVLYNDDLETTNIYPLTDIMVNDDFTGNIGQLAIPYLLENLGFRGTATLSSGTVTVSTDKVKTGYKIYLSVNTPSGTQGFLSAPTGSIVDGTEFVINSTSATDNSTVNWWIAP